MSSNPARPPTVDPDLSSRPIVRLKSPYNSSRIIHKEGGMEPMSQRPKTPNQRQQTAFQTQQEESGLDSNRVDSNRVDTNKVDSNRPSSRPGPPSQSKSPKFGLNYEGRIIPVTTPTLSKNDSVANLIAPECDPSSVLANGHNIPRPKIRTLAPNSAAYLIHVAETKEANPYQFSRSPSTSPSNLMHSKSSIRQNKPNFGFSQSPKNSMSPTNMPQSTSQRSPTDMSRPVSASPKAQNFDFSTANNRMAAY